MSTNNTNESLPLSLADLEEARAFLAYQYAPDEKPAAPTRELVSRLVALVDKVRESEQAKDAALHAALDAKEKAEAQLRERQKQIGIACEKHDLISGSACPACFSDFKAIIDKLPCDMDADGKTLHLHAGMSLWYVKPDVGPVEEVVEKVIPVEAPHGFLYWVATDKGACQSCRYYYKTEGAALSAAASSGAKEKQS